MHIGSLPVLVVGLLLGLRHALEADHIAAVSTIVSERKGIWSSSIVGAFWGLGHTASLMIVGFIVIVLGLQIPDVVADWLEFGVALMLIGLGVRVFWKLSRGAVVHVHTHEHNGHRHVHPHLHETAAEQDHAGHAVRQGRRPFLVGMVHGMAGSAALMLLILATIPSRLEALLYVGLFGLGSLVGMFLMTTIIGLPVVFVARHHRFQTVVQSAAGVLSLGMGLMLSWEIGSKLLGL